MTNVSSLIYSGYTASSSRSLTTDSQAEETATVATASSETDGSTDVVADALADAEALGEELASQWAEAQAKAEIVYQLITGEDMDGGETDDLVTNMLLSAYDELHVSSDSSASLEDMPSYAAALASWAEENGLTSTYSLLA